MAAEKHITSLMMFGQHQLRVIGKCTLADFMAMSGVSRDFISETANEADCAWLDKLPPRTLYYFPEASAKPIPVPESRIRYKSAKDKKDALRRAEMDKAERIRNHEAQRKEQAENKNAQVVERVAEKLYSYDRANLPWSEAGVSVQSMYRGRATELILLMRS